MSKEIKQFQLSYKLSKELQREAESLHVTLEDYITDILIDRHKLKQIKQIQSMETLIEKVETLIENNKPKPLAYSKSLTGLLTIAIVNTLKENGITTVGDLCNIRYSELVKLPGIGRVYTKAISDFMSLHNLSHRG